MKSKELKIYNIPRDKPPFLSMNIKPRRLLICVLWGSVILSCLNFEWSVIGLCGSAISVFALVAMPDRTLLDIYEDKIVVYDSRQMDNCFCIFWDELLTWQYIRGTYTDRLRLELIDGQHAECDVYRSRKLFFYLHLFAKGKEKKIVKRRGKMS